MKHVYSIFKNLLAAFVLLIAFAANAQEFLTIDMGNIELLPEQDTQLIALYINGTDTSSEGIKWNTDPGYLGKVSDDGILTAGQPGTGLLIAKYKELRDTVDLLVIVEPKNDDNNMYDMYPKVKIVPASIKVEVGDSVELYAFYVDSFDVKTDTMPFLWSVDPIGLGEFTDPANSMFQAGDLPGKGIVIAQYNGLADTVKIEVYESKRTKEKKEKEEKQNNGNSGKQITIEPGDMAVYSGADPILYSATYKTNGNKHQNAEFLWSVSDTSIASIDTTGLLTLKGETGMTLVNVEYSNFGASVELLVVDSMIDMDVNTISIHRVLPNGKQLKAKTFKEGDSYKIGGLPYPLNLLNAGMIHFPFGCIDEDIEIFMFIPEKYAEMNDDSTEVDFSWDIVTGVEFSVKPAGSDTIVEPYWFNIPVELKLVYKRDLIDSLGIDPQDLNMFFADSTGFIELDGQIATVDTARNRIYASIAHFSTIVVKEKAATTSVKDLTPVVQDMLDIYPNPFSSSTTIQFTLTDRGNVNISVYNIFGQKVQGLAEGEFTEGMHKIIWQGKDMNGAPATSGIYFFRFIKDGEVSAVKRIILNR
ncbi:T9SS type A sorting domain-containing protein [Prolixibacteraceae bacterium Z1-6]|uniref:T9SS type A sorting domain-containing protein n=1 Tax=Draconibacterium aestuarii TaxID=2998507 RepID=A0A9X3F641_9BACT|nr:T9SS type A sorting domain-containing protein [Prolixibacteraceae bacterium Z1-6]